MTLEVGVRLIFGGLTVVGLGVLALFLRPGAERPDARLAR
jgi:hypothetical protein